MRGVILSFINKKILGSALPWKETKRYATDFPVVPTREVRKFLIFITNWCISIRFDSLEWQSGHRCVWQYCFRLHPAILRQWTRKFYKPSIFFPNSGMNPISKLFFDILGWTQPKSYILQDFEKDPNIEEREQVLRGLALQGQVWQEQKRATMWLQRKRCAAGKLMIVLQDIKLQQDPGYVKSYVEKICRKNRFPRPAIFVLSWR